MPEGLLQGLAAALCWGSTDILAAVAARRIGSLATAALAQVSSFAAILVLLIADGGSIAAVGSEIPLAAVIGVISAIAYLSFYVALRLGPVAVVSPVGSAYGAVAVVLSIALLGERPSVGQALGVVMTTLGILAIGLVLKQGARAAGFVGPGVPFVVVALLSWGLMTVGMAELVRGAELIPVLFVMRAVASATVWGIVGGRLLLRRSVRRRLAERDAADGAVLATVPSRRLPLGAVAMTLVAGLLDVTGVIVYGVGLQVGQAWLVGITSSFGPAVVFLFAVAFLGDRLRPVQWLGLAGLAVGLVLVGSP